MRILDSPPDIAPGDELFHYHRFSSDRLKETVLNSQISMLSNSDHD
jgi:hypothetical protein